MGEPVRVFMELAYDGGLFHGWQRQPQCNSVQEELEMALSRLMRFPVAVVGCGRTDTGVHASYYVAHVQFDSSPLQGNRLQSWEQVVHKLNGILSDSIAVFRIAEVHPKAHARFSATERAYRYLLHNRKDAFLHGRSTRVHGKLDVNAMQHAAQMLVRKGDFAAFCKSGSGAQTTLCDVRHCRFLQVDAHTFEFHIVADRFLRNMVRAVVGTLLEIGKGRLSPADMEQILDSKDRRQAGKSAPPDGLYLSHVAYPPEIWTGPERSIPESPPINFVS